MSSAAGMLPTLRKKKTRKDMPRRESTYNGAPMPVSAKEKDKVQDRIKKRLSHKIGLPSMPTSSSMPMPMGAKQNVANANRIHIPRETQSSTTRPRVVRPVYDPAVFNDPDFDAEAYVKMMLATATPAELDDFFQALQDSKESTNTAMQKNVFQNYQNFIMISKEIRTLEADMGVIRGLLGDLRGITTTLKEDVVEEDLTRAAGRRGARNSIIDFHQLNKNHLKALWAQVEGAQKFLPADEGRRIIRESGAWLELNAATWRPKNKVHLVLLNDHLLVAQKRPKPSGSGQRLIAERCFPIGDLKIREFQDDDMQSTISARLISGREKFVFKAETLDEKRAMVLAFSREAGELQASLRRAENAEKRVTGSHDTSRDSQILRLSRRLSKLPAGLNRSGSIALPGDGTPETIDPAWIQERMDDLDQRIAHREWKEAVRSILKGRALVQTAATDDLAAELTSLKLDERADRLAHVLCLDLADESSKSRVVKELVALLVAIDRTDLARTTFLEARAALIQKRTRGVLFEGDLSLYISDLALVQFALIKNTATIYTAAFIAPQEMSGLIAWAKIQVEKFADVFNRQLYGVSVTSQSYQDSLEAVSRQIAVLRDIGLDLSFVVEGALGRTKS